MRKVQNLKCPCCGYIYNQTYNSSKEIERLISKRNESTKRILRKVFLLINKHIPADRDRDLQYKFLQAISNVKEIPIKWSINRYMMDNHYLSGKGLAYLKNIILNHNKNNKVMSKNERRSRGISPKVINLERNTDD
jgi:hypothetical protein|tara:strand:+ start:383 stop:790 length:408 start_codon:yes stop_codon:yes gene_type:complete